MKKLINDPAQAVSQMLSGMQHVYPELRYIPEYGVMCRAEKAADKVGLVSGGGSGHEPAHAGYVGKGMLDAAVCGNVFASPSPDRVLRGIREANGGKGVLLIIKNYSGDIMNFEMAQELATMEDIPVRAVVVRDDVAVKDSTFSTGRRGVAGTVFVHRIAGAKAERGASLDEVATTAQKVADNVRSMGLAMMPCTLPGAKSSNFTLSEDEIGLGIGIHGEPGIETKKVDTAARMTAELLERILADLDYSVTDNALMVNGLGGTPLMELYIVANEAVTQLEARGIKVSRIFAGNFMTSLEMSGCSLSLLRMDDEMKSLLDDPCDAPAFRKGGCSL